MSRNRHALLSSLVLAGFVGTAVPTRADAMSPTTVVPTQRDSAMRRDSIARAEQMRRDSTYRARAAMGSGLYIGVGGGTSLPLGEAKDDWKTGWAVFVPVGYDWPSWFGVRVDGSYEHWAGKSEGIFTYGPYKLAGLNADLKARVPLASGSTSVQLYGLAGGNFDHLTYGETSGESDSMNKVGWNAGAGLSFGWGVTSLLVESRYFSVSAEGGTLKWYPVVAGITYSLR